MNKYLFVQKISGQQDLVLDTDSCQLCRRKCLSIYDEGVYRYLQKHHHPNIVTILNVSNDDNKLVVIEKEIEGRTLRSCLDDPLTETDKEIIFDEIMDGVEFLHHAKPPIVHRDLKPENIMITNHKVVKIIDFDAAKTVSPHKSRDTVLIGTAGTAAPEQYGFQQSDARTDIYALGILAKEMFPEKQALISKATAIDPQNRYQTIHDLRKAFHRKYPPYSWQPFSLRSPHTFFRFLFFQLLFLLLAYMEKSGSTPARVFFNRTCTFAMFESLYMLYSKWTPLFQLLSTFENREIWIRLLIYSIVSIGILFFWALIASAFT